MSLLNRSVILFSVLAFWACSGDNITEIHMEEAAIASVEEKVDSVTVEPEVPSIENLEGS